MQPLPAFVFQEKRAYFREYSGDFGGFGRVGFSFDLGFIGDSADFGVSAIMVTGRFYKLACDVFTAIVP